MLRSPTLLPALMQFTRRYVLSLHNLGIQTSKINKYIIQNIGNRYESSMPTRGKLFYTIIILLAYFLVIIENTYSFLH